MKIKYEFANEAVEIEVEEKWATIILDLDREEYNGNHRETRRHCSLDALNLDDALLPSDVDVFEAVADTEGKRNLYQAINKLSPQQRKLIWRIYFQGEHPADIARELGVCVPCRHRGAELPQGIRRCRVLPVRLLHLEEAVLGAGTFSLSVAA